MSTTNPFLDNYQPLSPELLGAHGPATNGPPPASPPKVFAYDGENKREAAVNAQNATELMVRVSPPQLSVAHIFT